MLDFGAGIPSAIMQDSNKAISQNVMTALWITVWIVTVVCTLIFTVNLQSVNMARRIIDSSNNGTASVQVSCSG